MAIDPLARIVFRLVVAKCVSVSKGGFVND
jgi:hypothetical protein